MSSSVGYIGQFIALVVVNNLLLHIGGEGALAQFNVVQNVSYLSLSVYFAIGDTVQPLSATFHAEHNKHAISRVMSLGSNAGIVLGGAVAGLFAVFAPDVAALFGLKGSLISDGAFAVRLFCISVIPAGLNIIWSSCFQATKREKLVFLINQLRTFICFLVFAFVLSQYNLKWFWLVFICTETLTFLIWVQIAFFRKPPVSDKVFTYLLDASSSDISEMLSKAEAFCEEYDANPKQIYYVTMCIEEVCQAIIDNAFKQNGDEYIQLTLCCENDGTFVIHIRDNAVSFNPFAMKTGKDYEDDENLASLGIQMVKTKSKSFFYRRYANFNTLTVEV
jgi:anti-sigma regulatory factor (Ser/Thr protein kinase)